MKCYLGLATNGRWRYKLRLESMKYLAIVNRRMKRFMYVQVMAITVEDINLVY